MGHTGRNKKLVVPMPEPGDTLGGRWRIVSEIGSGGMGTVYEAVHVEQDAHVAVKVLAGDALDTPSSIERFHREARIAAQLRSQHVARVFEVGQSDRGLPFMVLELLKGNDLVHEIVRGPMPVMTAVDYARQALEALGEAHSYGVVHRDVKPANIFVCEAPPESPRRAVKMLDFGIAKAQDQVGLTRTFDSFGTPEYMSPEQIRATRDVDGRTDVWSVGVVLYEMLTGKVPFSGTATAVIASIVSLPLPPPRLLRPDIPPGLEAVLMKALQKDEALRYRTPQEFRDALATWAPRGRVSAPRTASLGSLVAPLGTVLVQSGTITEAQLKAALDRQKTAPGQRLGEVLVAIGACTSESIEAGLKEAARRGSAQTQRIEPLPSAPRLVAGERARGSGEHPPASGPFVPQAPVTASPSGPRPISDGALPGGDASAPSSRRSRPSVSEILAGADENSLLSRSGQVKAFNRTAFAGFLGALVALVVVGAIIVVALVATR